MADALDLFHEGKNISVKQQYLENEESFGSLLYKIVKEKYGEEVIDWEFDTLVMELSRFAEVPDVNLDKIMAFISMDNSFDGSFSFFNEMNCFMHTVNATNNLEPDYEFLGALQPQHIQWTMYEMDLIYPGYKLDEEPAKMMGLSYHKVGYFLLPDDLSEYQEFLDYYNKNTELVPRIRKEWESFKKSNRDIDSLDIDDIVEQQILMLLSNEHYMKYKKDAYQRDVERLYE